MGIFQRFSNVLRAKANKTMDKVENPIELLELQIKDATEAIKKAKGESASLIGSIPNIDKNISDLEGKLQEFNKAAKNAKTKMEASTSEEEKAKHKEAAMNFLKKADEVTKEIESKKTLKSKNQQQITIVKTNIERLENRVKQLNVKKDELKSRANTAEAAAKVNEILSGINDNSFKSLDEIEREIEQKENYATGLDEMTDKTDEQMSEYLSQDSDLEDKFNSL